MRPVVWSASSLNAYLACHLRWFFTYVAMFPGEESEERSVGIAVHDLAEQTLRVLASLGRRPSDVVDVEPAGAGPAFVVFVHDVLPTYDTPVLIEAPFQLEIDGVPYSGVIDAVDYRVADREPGNPSHYVLRDLKTTGSRPGKGQYRRNMIGYWLGARDLGYEPDTILLDYIVRTKTPYYWPEEQPIPDEDEIASFSATLARAADGVAQEDFAATGLGTWNCGACEHRNICGPYQRYKEVIA